MKGGEIVEALVAGGLGRGKAGDLVWRDGERAYLRRPEAAELYAAVAVGNKRRVLEAATKYCLDKLEGAEDVTPAVVAGVVKTLVGLADDVRGVADEEEPSALRSFLDEERRLAGKDG